MTVPSHAAKIRPIDDPVDQSDVDEFATCLSQVRLRLPPHSTDIASSNPNWARAAFRHGLQRLSSPALICGRPFHVEGDPTRFPPPPRRRVDRQIRNLRRDIFKGSIAGAVSQFLNASPLPAETHRNTDRTAKTMRGSDMLTEPRAECGSGPSS